MSIHSLAISNPTDVQDIPFVHLWWYFPLAFSQRIKKKKKKKSVG